MVILSLDVSSLCHLHNYQPVTWPMSALSLGHCPLTCNWPSITKANDVTWLVSILHLDHWPSSNLTIVHPPTWPQSTLQLHNHCHNCLPFNFATVLPSTWSLTNNLPVVLFEWQKKFMSILKTYGIWCHRMTHEITGCHMTCCHKVTYDVIWEINDVIPMMYDVTWWHNYGVKRWHLMSQGAIWHVATGWHMMIIWCHIRDIWCHRVIYDVISYE